MRFGPSVFLDDPDAQKDRRLRRGTGVRKPRRKYVKMLEPQITRDQAVELLHDLCDPKNLSSYLGLMG